MTSPMRHPMRVLLIVSASPFSSLLSPRLQGSLALQPPWCDSRLFSSQVPHGQSHCQDQPLSICIRPEGLSILWFGGRLSGICSIVHLILSDSFSLFLCGSTRTQPTSSPSPSWWRYFLLSSSSPAIGPGTWGRLRMLACLHPSPMSAPSRLSTCDPLN